MSRCLLCKGRNTCHFKYIKIEGQVYKRDTGNIFDDEYNFEGSTTPWSIASKTSLRGMSCHDCGVLYGNTHHTECDHERCPKDSSQLLSCGHLLGARFYRGLADSKGVKPDVPINPVIAEKLRHSPGEIKFRYDHWLKECISDCLRYEDKRKLKTYPEYKHYLIVLRNILDRMTNEEGDVMLSNEQVYCVWWLMEGHIHLKVKPRKAARYLKIIDKNWRPRRVGT
jgi:hypothetical protein